MRGDGNTCYDTCAAIATVYHYIANPVRHERVHVSDETSSLLLSLMVSYDLFGSRQLYLYRLF